MGRVLLFCFGCAITLAITSGFAKSLSKPWNNLAALIAAILVTIGLTILFTRWERTGLKDVGMVPGKYSISRLSLGLIIGLVMSCSQPLLLLLLNSHIRLVLSAKILL